MSDFITGPQVPIGSDYFDLTQVSMARMLGKSCPAIPPTDPTASNNFILHLQYYDLPKSEYTVFERTGDIEFRDYGRNAADSWWLGPYVQSGTYRPFPDSASPAPRHAGIGGLILRAKDGKPEYWDWIVAYTQALLDIYLTSRVANTSIHTDIREGAFVFHYATWLSKELPDSFPNGAQIRAKFNADLEKIVNEYYWRLRQPCGCWTFDIDMPDSDGGTFVGVTQPFTLGLLLLAFADFHLITTNTLVKDRLRTMILEVSRHMYLDMYRKNDVSVFDPTIRLRFFWYLFHGGTTINPTKFAKGGHSWPGNNRGEIQDGRQSIGPVIGIYGYAHLISGDPFYLDALNEMWDAAYGETDGIKTYYATDGKGFNQHCARAGSTKAWSTVNTRPGPTPVPVPVPPPIPVESSDGAKSTSIVDSERAVWTLGPAPGLQTLRNGTHAGAGAGSIYKYVSKTVYTLGTDKNWYKWSGAWSSVGAEPGTITLPPPPPPPPPPPSQIRKLAQPTSEKAWNTLLAQQKGEGFFLTKFLTGAFVQFEKI